MSEFIPFFGSLSFTILAFLVALTIIVFIHEYGHYIIARLSGIHAEVFSIGFGPVLYSRMDRRGTQWQVAALPLGGFVKFAGDANAASGPANEDGEAPLGRHTMYGAPIWARMATVLAGPFFNFFASIAIFAALLLYVGKPTEPTTVAGLGPFPEEITLQEGDEILSISGVALEEVNDYLTENPPQTRVLPYQVRRNGQVIDVQGPNPSVPIVGAVLARSAAYDAGIEKEDVLLRLNGQELYAFATLKDGVESSDGAPQTLDIWRRGEVLSVTLNAKRMDIETDEGFITRWRIGIVGGTILEPGTERLGLFEALSKGVEQVWYIIRGSVTGLTAMIAGEISTCNLSGPIGIAETSGAAAAAGIQDFIWFIAVLSTAIGFVNLLPIPVLDGGHALLFSIEAITKRRPSARVVNMLMLVGLSLVLSLMIFGVTNDLLC